MVINFTPQRDVNSNPYPNPKNNKLKADPRVKDNFFMGYAHSHFVMGHFSRPIKIIIIVNNYYSLKSR